MKPGIRTTEFWLALGVVILGAVASVYTESEWGRIAGTVAAALVAAGYGFSRMVTKAAEARTPSVTVSNRVGEVERSVTKRGTEA